MAKHVLTNAEVLVNAVDLSDHVSSVTIETTRPEVDVTAMGATYQEFIPGLADATVTINFFQDFAAAKTHATLQPLSTTSTAVQPVDQAGQGRGDLGDEPADPDDRAAVHVQPVGGDGGRGEPVRGHVPQRLADRHRLRHHPVMALLATTAASLTGALYPATAVSSSDTFVPGGDVYLQVTNGGGSPDTVAIVSPQDDARAGDR